MRGSGVRTWRRPISTKMRQALIRSARRRERHVKQKSGASKQRRRDARDRRKEK